jgi:hypothetical protein
MSLRDCASERRPDQADLAFIGVFVRLQSATHGT